MEGHKVNGHPVERSAAASFSEEEAAATCQKGKKSVRIGEGTGSDSIQFNSIRNAWLSISGIIPVLPF